MSERDYWALRMRQTGALIGEEWTEFAEFVGRVRGADPAAVIRPEFAGGNRQSARDAGMPAGDPVQ
jgi:hypothetical protein